MFEFHISRFARDKYDFDLSIYQFTGNVILADFAAARAFAQKMNQQRDLIMVPEQAVRASEINAMGLIDEILHAIAAEYRSQVNPKALQKALSAAYGELGTESVNIILANFTGQFPPVAVYKNGDSPDAYLAGSTGELSHKEIVLEELMMLWLSNINPAFRRYEELFDDGLLQNQTNYHKLISILDSHFDGEPGFGKNNISLFELLQAPARKHPDSLFSQLEYLLDKYSSLLAKYNFRLLRSLDFMREENKVGFTGPGPAQVLEFQSNSSGEEIEKYSPDSEWMPTLVLIAKNTYVWLDQLSKKYGRSIQRLDQIPQEELTQLANWGFSGLWLIGLWERSTASKRIKHLTGNLDAVSSAYSLYDYNVAHDLGGDEAYETLRVRANASGLRLAADMVPNHTGIYSKWVVEHPDWYINRDYSPFPSYSFNGENISPDPRVGIYLEDHYYEQTDAAVVFKRVDFDTGRTHYIYHGNDGTSMPWNDTAQLNYLNPEAREAVIQTIIKVARKFPIIRFDAAMTLAKKHIQRLWFPEPGHGGAIPSRSENSLPKMRFDEFIPVEFWREVVDRIAQEVPNTLLLAEAFWMMEGFFVRTLGMHRVYNSAFMNMMRDEKNAEYRQVIKNTIEFDPEILKRYVNFMNNPDEETAIEQFGDGGKYFGVCVLLTTMPGLPMFGHGQVEGLKEKYGMEYQRAYYDETPSQDLIRRHEREIFPLLHRREIFADVKNFLLFDLLSTSGGVVEDVYAYSNRSGNNTSLVFFHNKWGETSGTIHRSSPYTSKDADGNSVTKTKTIGEGLALPDDPSKYVIFRDQITDLEYIRSCAEIHSHGFSAALGAFNYHVFLDFRIVSDNEWGHYRLIMEYLDGRGVHNLEEVKQEVILQPILQPWNALINPGFFNWVFNVANNEPRNSVPFKEVMEQTHAKILGLLTGIAGFISIEADLEELADEILTLFEIALLHLPKTAPPIDRAILLSWALTHPIGRIRSEINFAEQSRAWMDEWLLGKIIAENLKAFGDDENCLAVTALIVGKRPEFWLAPAALETFKTWMKDGDTSAFLGVNRYKDVLWYDQNALLLLLHWVTILQNVARDLSGTERLDNEKEANKPLEPDVISKIREASLIAGFKVDPLLIGLELDA